LKENHLIRFKKLFTITLTLFVVISIVFLIAKEKRKIESTQKAAKHNENRLKTNEQESEKTDRLNVYYFYTTIRCSSCHKIENYTRKTIESVFKKELDQGTIVFRELNIDKPENKHFIKDFKLYTKSVIVEQRVKGKKRKWQNLEKVWELLNDEIQFSFYIEEEIKNHLREVGL